MTTHERLSDLISFNATEVSLIPARSRHQAYQWRIYRFKILQAASDESAISFWNPYGTNYTNYTHKGWRIHDVKEAYIIPLRS